MQFIPGVKYKKCPRCGQRKFHPIKTMNALSRRDNETYICSDCGVEEAMEDFCNFILRKRDRVKQ